ATMCQEEKLTPLELIKWIHASPKVPNLKKRKYSDFKIEDGEWELLKLVHDVLRFSRVRHGIEKGLDKLHKWYMATDQTDIYFICLALEPSVKLEYTKQKWDKDCYDKGVAAFE
ncbi:hypothetical protein M405DRAFT_706535, partial [Rhizopogon salebrosus TDB-379]